MEIGTSQRSPRIVGALVLVFTFCGMRCGGVLSTPTTSKGSSAEVFVDVATAAQTTCGLTTSGKVYCWGQLTLSGTTTESATPRLLSALPETESLTATQSGICGIAAGGASVWCFGGNQLSVFGDAFANATYAANSPFTATVASLIGSAGALGETTGSTRCAIKASQQVMCWGGNTYGEIGDNSTTPRSTPVAVGSTGMLQIATGFFTTCGVTKNGTIECWGRGDNGQLGNSTTNDSTGTVAVVGLSGLAAEVYPGDSITCARLISGEVQCWGYNGNGGVGDNYACGFPPCTTAQTVSGITTATQLRVVGQSAVVILADGTLRCWGTNISGQFGNGTTDSSPLPVACGSGLSGVTKIRFGNNGGSTTACAVLESGTIACWGNNAASQAGISSSTTTSVLTPSTQISVP